MPRKKKLVEMAATGKTEEAELEECLDSDLLVETCRRNDSFTLVAGSETWSLPKAGLCRESNGNTKSRLRLPGHHATAVPLFIQWFFTRRYQEKDFRTSLISVDDSLEFSEEDNHQTMPWPLKAAILSWYLSDALDAPEFSNYAITRVYEALSRSSGTAEVRPEIFSPRREMLVRAALGRSSLKRFIEDITVRNWGDTATVNHSNEEGWHELLKKYPRFQKALNKATMLPLEKRREKAMQLSLYLVKEDLVKEE
ncbi:hypothetical protein BDV95DRAFT_595628 [Massariosphaeria phaeospora]|uniref:BTB domain-containing protein n=1 Tax=Massariosphaeria phaeospora TaxID=100035 RepID=A0A7C8M6N0_9PLEO|nr:hypothetical protein BDV95DRAFT_595628 [Massariosphaeria phaeospora]